MSNAYETEIAQDENEITAFVEIIKREKVQSYLEIGSKFGGSLWRVANAMHKGSRVVSVDMPNGTIKWRHTEPSLIECVAELKHRGYDVSVLWGNSTSAEIIAQVKGLGSFDCVLIDANHTLPYITADWNNYGPMARIVAFHDISWAPRRDKPPIEVPAFWNALKADYRHEEIRLDPSGKNNGIGVLWRS